MKITPTEIPDVLTIEPRVFEDERGFFLESFNAKIFEQETGLDCHFVQDNHSKSVKNVLRGLHYQLPPMAQGKLVRVVRGDIFDVAIDIRKSSPTFGQWVGEILSAENKKQLWIPEGFAHGFLTLSDETEVLYKTTNFYSPEHDRSIRWDDLTLNITWPSNTTPLISPKDSEASDFESAEVFQ